ncbi:hypothetical protein GWL_32200 [Herbaspirillum sp. GW103]|jgi:hypothetical protein|uniref:DUF6776 family protein n=1 Tax=unclassified Herbaspirillum TaxID=2624150 RepID=UPI00025E43B6|nr:MULTISPECIES: DUF6776 family protein [unclassified Herbaspirillum]EIJ46192.1 hypothetical protein GWL_32200 [Herbaspirillum sp. GW103]MCI1003591.1 hypothetical protein [Herbaspirillum sp. C7C8]
MTISAPKMTIKRHLPWPLMILLWAAVVGVGAAAAVWTYQLGRNNLPGLQADAGDASEQIEQLSEQVKKLSAENERLQSAANASQNELKIAQTAQATLATQVKNLEAENNRQKEDLAFFDSLLPTNLGAPGITIQRFKAEQAAPNQVRYRVLVMQGGGGTQQFAGNLQLSVNMVQGGKGVTINFPESNATDQARYRLAFKYYQRVEGLLTIPEGAIVKSVAVRVLDRGQVRAQQSVDL